MYQMKLARLCHFGSLTKEQKSDFLKQLDVNETSQDEDLLGFSPLHFAVRHHSSDLVNELIRRGADVLKQETRHKRTPLHSIAIDKIDSHKKSFVFFRLVDELSNSLLSAHIKTNNATNPVCDTGVSHFHIACFFNHEEAIHFFINSGVPINQVTEIGCTPLHFAVKSCSVQAIKILLTHGADINLKDEKGISSLDLLIQNLDDDDDVEWIDTVLNFILKLKMEDPIFLDSSEITLFHMTCMLKNKSVAVDFITKGYSFDRCVSESSKIWSGWTPLHFAACCNLEIFELLIQNGVNLDIKLATGETPLDLCGMKYVPATVGKLLSAINKFQDISLSNSSIKLSEVLEAMDSYEKFIHFLDDLSDIDISVPFNAIIWPGYSILHLLVLMNQGAKKFDKNSNSCTFSDLLKYGIYNFDLTSHAKKIEACLKKGCNVSLKNADGLTPIHLAFNMQQINVVNKLLPYCQEDVLGRHDLSHLHIACILGDVNAVKQLLSKGAANIKSQVGQSFEWFQMSHDGDKYHKHDVIVEAQSTPLHMAVIFRHNEVAEYLVENGADIFAKDAQGWTPIHQTMYSSKHLARYLLGHALQDFPLSKEVMFPEIFSYLFVAGFADDDKAIKTLLKNGVSVNISLEQELNPKFSYAESLAEGSTPLDVAVHTDSDKAVCALIKGGANIFVENPHCEFISPLQRALDKANETLFKYFSETLRRNETTMGSLDSTGLTQLHLACASYNLEWATELLQRGADVNATMSISSSKTSKGMTPLCLLVFEGCTFKGIPPDFMNLLHLLLQKGADVTIDYKTNLVPLKYVYAKWLQHKNDIPAGEDDYFDDDDEIQYELLPFLEIADLLLESQKSHTINPADSNGFSHFHYACLRNNVEIVKKFLDNGVDVNQMTCPFLKENGGFSPLHFAIAYRSERVIPLLIEYGADVKAENVKGNTPLHIAITNGFVDLPLFEELLRHGANINAQNLSGETPMMCLLNAKGLTLKKLHFFIDRGAVIDVSNHDESISKVFNAAIENSTPEDVVPIYKALLNICNVENVCEKSFNAIRSIMSNDDRIVTFDFYLDTIKQLLELGCDINGQDENGGTALQTAAIHNDNEAVKALLILGADVGIVDNKGNSCLTESVLDYIECYDGIDDESGANYMNTLKTLANHAQKMKLVKLDIVDSFAKVVQSAERIFDADFERTLQNELTMMENKTIGQELPVRSFLSEWGAVVEYPMMHFVLREAVDEFFSDIDSLLKEFPQFCGLLMMQYRRALKRIDLVRSAKYVITTECGIELPDLCLEAIFRYFKNDDLEILTSDYTDETFHPCKRQKIG